MTKQLKILHKGIKRAKAAVDPRMSSSLLQSMRRVAPLAERIGVLPPGRASVWRAQALRQQGRLEQALILLEKALITTPGAPALVEEFGEVLQGLGRYEEAENHWQQAVKLYPKDQRSWSGYTAFLHHAGRHRDIKPLLERCLDEAPRSGGQSAVVAAEISKRYAPLAFDTLMAAGVEMVDDEPEALWRFAKLHVKAGDLGIALNQLDRLKELGKEKPFKRLNPKRVDKLRHDVLDECNKLGIQAVQLSPGQRRPIRLPETALAILIERSKPTSLDARRSVAMAVTTLGPGGGERQLVNTVNGLRDQKLVDEIRIVQARNRDGDIDDFYKSQFTGSTMPRSTAKGRSVDMDQLMEQHGDHLRLFMSTLPNPLQRQIGEFAAEFNEHRPDVVHCWSDQRNMISGVAAVIVGTPLVILSTRSVSPIGNRPVPRHYKEVYRTLLRCPNVRLINNSQAGANTYADWLEIDPASIDVIHNGIDTDRLIDRRDLEATRRHRQELGFDADTKVVGSLIRFSSEKRPRLWLEAAARLLELNPDVRFVLVGDGVEQAKAKSYSKELGIADQVHFMGLIKDVVPWYDLMDIVLLTSSREGTSNTALEAQALGKPVIAPDVGGMGEAIAVDKSGLLLSANPTADEIARRLEDVIKNKAWREAAAIEGPAFIRQRFSIERMAKDTAKIYKKPADSR